MKDYTCEKKLEIRDVNTEWISQILE